MGLRGGEERGSQREEKKWYGRIIAEEMDEGKGLSVQTSLFLTEAKLSDPQERKKKKAITRFSSQKHRQYTRYFWFWVRVMRWASSRNKHHIWGDKKRGLWFLLFISLTHTCSSTATESRPDEGGERHLQHWQTAEFWSHLCFSKVNCKLPASVLTLGEHIASHGSRMA